MIRSYKNRQARLYQRIIAVSGGTKPFTKVTSPKSIVSANSTTGADISGRATCRYFVALCFYTVRKPRRSVTLNPQL